MKKLITILLISFLAVNTSLAQIEQGTVILGATTELSSTAWSQVAMQPSIGYFVSDYMAIGLGLEFGTSSLDTEVGVAGSGTEYTSTESTSNLAIGPWMRFYLSEMFFLNAGVEIGSGSGPNTTYSGPGAPSGFSAETSTSSLGFDIGAGASILWGDHIAFEPMFGLDFESGSSEVTVTSGSTTTTTTTNLPTTMNLGFKVGVCIMLGN